ncbi:MAG TPA: nuclear transport factor 2 family protein [Ktedonobacteraceae bacterium]|nr:nuclear transport factor 2 family protein [Ktedonobacteraceae bacterium]
MNATEIVQTFITALQSGDMDMAAQYMMDDFVFEGWTPQALDKGEFLALQSELHAAMPDYTFNLSDTREEDGIVDAFIQISGTHTQTLSLPMFGVPLVPYTGISVELPQTRTRFTVRDGKVARMQVEPLPGGGLNGLLQQIDTELLPSPQVGVIYEVARDEREQEMEAHGESPPWREADTMTDKDAG